MMNINGCALCVTITNNAAFRPLHSLGPDVPCGDLTTDQIIAFCNKKKKKKVRGTSI